MRRERQEKQGDNRRIVYEKRGRQGAPSLREQSIRFVRCVEARRAAGRAVFQFARSPAALTLTRLVWPA